MFLWLLEDISPHIYSLVRTEEDCGVRRNVLNEVQVSYFNLKRRVTRNYEPGRSLL